MKKYIVCLLIAFSAMQESKTQSTRYIIQFKDKATNPYSIANPSAYLSTRALARRTRYNIPIDSTDLPVTPRYIDSVRLAGAVTVLNVSKWLNALTIQTTDAAALSKINSFSFVQSSSAIAARVNTGNGVSNKFRSGIQSTGFIKSNKSFNPEPARTFDITADFFNYGSSYTQVHIHNGEFLHNIGLRGQAMIIGMLDAGFNNYLTVNAFDSARTNGQILDTWDFVAKEASVNEDNAHGMETFSVIAANIPGQFVGTAPKASFYLFRSEDVFSEYPIEEHNWVCAAERVDSAGGDVISSSLGYNTFDNAAFNYSYADMNGNTTISAIGADLAAKKGILVINAAGNEGGSSWGKIITPADGDSVMAVGAVNAAGVAAVFSGRGPSSDGQIKPDVVSIGVNTVVQLPNNTIGTSNGTSFACPNIAGLATCLWQGFQEFNNMKIVNALRQSGSRATNPNDSVGYGIPDVKKAVLILLKDFSTTSAAVTNCTTAINWKSKDINTMKYEIERKQPGENVFSKIAERPASGKSFTANMYTYSDTLLNAQAGTIIYRVRQIIDTASATFSADYIDTVSVSLSNSCITTGINPIANNGDEITIVPNPVENNFKIKVTTPGAIQNIIIQIINAKGQIVSTERKSKGSGTAFFYIPVMQFASGKYYVRIYTDSKLLGTKEFIKL